KVAEGRAAQVGVGPGEDQGPRPVVVDASAATDDPGEGEGSLAAPDLDGGAGVADAAVDRQAGAAAAGVELGVGGQRHVQAECVGAGGAGGVEAAGQGHGVAAHGVAGAGEADGVEGVADEVVGGGGLSGPRPEDQDVTGLGGRPRLPVEAVGPVAVRAGPGPD